MFSVFRRSITRQVNRIRREFQEVIRPVVDRAVENSFERYWQRGAVANNPINSSNSNSYNSFTDFFARHHVIINVGLSTFSIFISLVGIKIGFDALQVQQEANILQEELIRSNREVAESNRELAEVNRQLADALNQPNNSEESSGSSYRVLRAIGDLFQVSRTLFDLRRFFANRDGGRPSGRRNPNGTEFNTPPSGSAHRDRKV